MKLAIAELETRLETLLTNHCRAVENGDEVGADRTGTMAHEFASAVNVLKSHLYGDIDARYREALESF